MDRLVEENGCFISIIGSKPMNWIGHTLRRATEGKVEGKKPLERPRMKMLNWMYEEENEISTYKYCLIKLNATRQRKVVPVEQGPIER